MSSEGVHSPNVKEKKKPEGSCSFGKKKKNEEAGMGCWTFYKLFPTLHENTAVKINTTPKPGSQATNSPPPCLFPAATSIARSGTNAQPARKLPGVRGDVEETPDPELGCASGPSPLTRGGKKLQIHFFRLDDGEGRFEIDGRLHGARSGGRTG